MGMTTAGVSSNDSGDFEREEEPDDGEDGGRCAVTGAEIHGREKEGGAEGGTVNSSSMFQPTDLVNIEAHKLVSTGKKSRMFVVAVAEKS